MSAIISLSTISGYNAKKHRNFPHGMPYHIDIGQIMTIAILQNILSHQVITEFLSMKTASVIAEVNK
jgi:hypothetical protein